MKLNTNTPHVDPDWSEAFLLELRLQGVAGHRIGAALAEVEAHCAESGQSAQAAYGDPVEFARALDLPSSPGQQISFARDIVPAGLGLAGMLSTQLALAFWRLDQRIEVSLGLVVSATLMVVGLLVLSAFAGRLMRLIVEHRWTAYALAVLPIGVFVVVLMLGRTTLFTLPVLPVLIAGLVLLAVSTGLYVRAQRRGELGDEITGPEALGAAAPGTMRTTLNTRVASGLTPWLFPLLTVLMSIPLAFLR